MNTENPPAPKAAMPASADDTGVYAFFRRHQKLLLYTAGLFTLLTFSITGPVMSLARELFGAQQPMPTIEVGGRRIALTPEDFQYGTILARNLNTALPRGVLPPINPGEGGASELSEVLAILRRAAIAEGIEASGDEVDRAIEAEREERKAESAARMARDRSFASLAQFRDVVAEAMRIGTYVRLQMLAVDSSDARILQQLTRDKEKIVLRVVTFDEKAVEEDLKRAASVGEEELRQWLDGKDDREKSRIGVFDLPRAELRFAGLATGPGEFDPAEWQDGPLKEFEVEDEQLKALYEQEKAVRFALEDGGFRPLEDETVRDELARVVQADHVVNQLLGQLRQRLNETLAPMQEELGRAQAEAMAADAALREAEREVEARTAELARAQQEFAARPEDEQAREALTAAEAALQQAKETLFGANEVLPAKQAAATAAQDAIKAARGGFDMPAAFRELVAGKKGLVERAMTGAHNGEELKDLDALGLDLGKWPLAAQAARLPNVGDLGFGTGRTTKAVLVYQATALEPKPLKPWEELKPLVEGAYWSEKAKAQASDKRKELAGALLRLAKERIPEFTAEREQDREGRIDRQLAEWQEALEAEIREAEQVLARPNLGRQARNDWQRKLDNRRAQLARRTERREEITTEVQKAIDAEIAAEARKHYGEVLAAAASETGLSVAEFGPYPRDLQSQPRFDKNYDPTVVFLWRNQSKLKAGEATDILDDPTNRRFHVAVCDRVEPMSPADVTRREFEMLRTGFGFGSFATLQQFYTTQHAFSHEALVARYSFRRPVGELTDPARTPLPAGEDGAPK